MLLTNYGNFKKDILQEQLLEQNRMVTLG